MRLLLLVERGKESVPETEELQKTLLLGELVDQATTTLEELVQQTPDLTIVQNQAGECYTIEQSKVRRSLRTLYEVAVAIRGTSQDYYNLACIETDIARSMNEDSEALPYYHSSIRCLRKVRKEDRGDSYHSTLAINLFLLWQCMNEEVQGEQGQPFLQEAYTEAQKLTESKYILNSHERFCFGQIFVEMADSNDPTIELHQKNRLFRKGIKYLQEVADSDKETCDFYELGNAQAKFLDHCLDFHEQRNLREQAINNLRKSYELDKDPETLVYIREIEEDGFGLSC